VPSNVDCKFIRFIPVKVYLTVYDKQRIGYEWTQPPFSASCNEFASVFYLRNYVTIEVS